MSAGVVTGSCLCGQVAFAVEGSYLFFHYCHCSRCRKTTGSAHAANLFVKREQFRWTRGEELVRRFLLPSAQYFCTGFCSECGSNLPWVTRNDRFVLVPAGSLDEVPATTPSRNVHWASRAPWYVSPATLPTFDTEP